MYSEVTDKKEKTHSVSYYGYDAFGRRILEQDKDEAALRSVYDGFTFDVIKQSPTFANGLFVDSNEIGIRISRTGRPTGDRYRYLEDHFYEVILFVYSKTPSFALFVIFIAALNIP